MTTSMRTQQSQVTHVILPFGWVDSGLFDESVHERVSPQDTALRINVTAGAKLTVDAAIRLLTFAEEWTESGKELEIKFSDSHDMSLARLHRIGYFDFLPASAVLVGTTSKNPSDPQGLFEIVQVTGAKPELPPIIFEQLLMQYSSRVVAMDVVNIIDELLTNILEHSGRGDGYVGMQLSQCSRIATIVASDRGTGLLESLSSQLQDLEINDLGKDQLLNKLLNEGLSIKKYRPSETGLSRAARRASKYRPVISICLEHIHADIELTPYGYQVTRLVEVESFVKGTTITFDLDLDHFSGKH